MLLNFSQNLGLDVQQCNSMVTTGSNLLLDSSVIQWKIV